MIDIVIGVRQLDIFAAPLIYKIYKVYKVYKVYKIYKIYMI